MLFQTISRNNSPCGTPYRLHIVYSANGRIVEAYESRSSNPSITEELHKRHSVLPTMHLTPKLYQELKKKVEPVLVLCHPNLTFLT